MNASTWARRAGLAARGLRPADPAETDLPRSGSCSLRGDARSGPCRLPSSFRCHTIRLTWNP